MQFGAMPLHGSPRIGVALAGLLFSGYAHATGEHLTTGAASGALGGTCATQVNLFCAMNNQAGLGFLESFQAGVFAEQRFVGLGLGHYAAAIALPTTTGTFALSANYFGYNLCSDTRLGLAFGKSLGTKLSMGVQFNYIATSIPEYGSASAVAMAVGILAKPSQKWSLGAQVFNPTQARLGQFEERLPATITIGAGYQSSDKLLLTAEIEKDIQFSPNFKAGLQFNLTPKVMLRGGFGSNPALLTFGVGFHLSNMSVDLANSLHTLLGSSPQASFVYEAGSK